MLCLNLCPAFLFFILKIVMDMEIQILNFRKESLSKLRLLIFLSLSVFSFSVKAVGNVVNNANVDSLISGIGYDYQLFNNNQNELDCVGVLKLTITASSNVEKFLFERTKPHISEVKDAYFLLKSEIPYNKNESVINFSFPNIYWGSYFMICAIFNDVSRAYSTSYSVNDFIEKSDLKHLEDKSELEQIDTDAPSIYIVDKNLHVDSSVLFSLSIFDLSGRLLQSGKFIRSTMIPLDNIESPMVVVKCTTSSFSISKKLVLK